MTKYDSELEDIPKHLHLTNKQRKVLKGEESPDRPGEILKLILNNKVKYIPARFKRLFSDIALLEQAGFFDSNWDSETFSRVQMDRDWIESYDWKEDVYDSFWGYDKERDQKLEKISQFSSSDENISDLTHAKQIGIELGNVSNSLIYEGISEDEKEYLAFGFLISIFITNREEEDIKQKYQILMEKLNNFENIVQDWYFMSSHLHNAVEESNNYISELQKIVNKAIIDEDLTSSIILRNLVFTTAFDLVNDGIVQKNPLEIHMNQKEGLSKEELKQGKIIQAEEVIRNIKENTNISETEYLIESMRHICLFLKNNNETWEVFKDIFYGMNEEDMDYPIRNPDRFFEKNSGEKMGRVRTLANEKTATTEGRSNYIQFPLMTEDLSSRGNPWRVTPIGELVGHILCTENNPELVAELPHRYALGAEISDDNHDLVERALNQATA